MRKVIAIFAIATLTACGGASTEVKADSAAAQIDSAAAPVADSSAAKVVADSVAK